MLGDESVRGYHGGVYRGDDQEGASDEKGYGRLMKRAKNQAAPPTRDRLLAGTSGSSKDLFVAVEDVEPGDAGLTGAGLPRGASVPQGLQSGILSF